MKCKRETDGRRLNDAGKEAIRLRALRMVSKGLSPEQVAKDVDIDRRTIYGWLEKYHYGGLEALKRKPRPGAKPKNLFLRSSQEENQEGETDKLQAGVERALSVLL